MSSSSSSSRFSASAAEFVPGGAGGSAASAAAASPQEGVLSMAQLLQIKRETFTIEGVDSVKKALLEQHGDDQIFLVADSMPPAEVVGRRGWRGPGNRRHDRRRDHDDSSPAPLPPKVTTPVELRKSENAWVPSNVGGETAESGSVEWARTTARGLFNKLAPDTAERILAQLLALGASLSSVEAVREVADIVVAKAGTDPTYCHLYAQMAGAMCEHGAGRLAGLEQSDARTSAQAPAESRPASFRSCLLDSCQEAVEAAATEAGDGFGWAGGEEIASDAAEEELLEKQLAMAKDEFDEADDIRRKRRLALNRFVGELVNFEVLPTKVAHRLVCAMLRGWEQHGEGQTAREAAAEARAAAQAAQPAQVEALAPAPAQPEAQPEAVALAGDDDDWDELAGPVAAPAPAPAPASQLPEDPVEAAALRASARIKARHRRADERTQVAIELLSVCGRALDVDGSNASHTLVESYLGIFKRLCKRRTIASKLRFAMEEVASNREDGWTRQGLRRHHTALSTAQVETAARVSSLRKVDASAAAVVAEQMQAAGQDDDGWEMAVSEQTKKRLAAAEKARSGRAAGGGARHHQDRRRHNDRRGGGRRGGHEEPARPAGRSVRVRVDMQKAQAAAEQPRVSPDRFKRLVRSVLDEWCSVGPSCLGDEVATITEEVMSGVALQSRPATMLRFMEKAIDHAMNAPSAEVAGKMQGLASLLAALAYEVEPPVVTKRVALDGLMLIVDTLADVTVDVPAAPRYMGCLVGHLDVEELLSIGEVQTAVHREGGRLKAAIIDSGKKIGEKLLRSALAERKERSGKAIERSAGVIPGRWAEGDRGRSLFGELHAEGLID